MLATVGEIKERLGIADADTTQDADLASLLDVAGAKILDVTRYVEIDEAGRKQILRNVQQGREYRLEKRTISGTGFTVEGRGHGADYVALTADLIDPDDGVFMVLAGADWWPPNNREYRAPRFRRWREPIWPVVRVTYDVVGVGEDCPAQLREATISLAIYWLGLSSSGAVSEVRIGQLAQTYMDAPLPTHVTSMLGRHYSATGATWVR